MFVAMGDPLYPSQYERIPNYEGFTPQSAVSSFNTPLIYDSTLTTPVSLGADSPVLSSKPSASTIHWGHEQSQMNNPMRDNRAIFSHNQNNNRMESNAKDSTLSLQVPQGSNGDLGLGFSTYNMFDSPQIPCPPTPYFGSYGVSGAQVTSPTPSLPSNTHSASQLSSASTPSMHHSIPLGQNNAPNLITPTPGQLRPSKRSHDSPIKTEHHGMQYPSRPLHQHEQSPIHFSPPVKRESPPLSQSTQKRQKQSDPMTPLFNQNQRMPLTDGSNAEFHGSQSRFKPLGNTQSPQPVMTEEEQFLIHLRKGREPKPDWKTTVEEFKAHTGKEFRIPALQMRYSRLNERLRVWSAKDITALTRSKAEFEKSKWESVANGMMKYECEVKWSARACQQKYAELNPEELDEAPLEDSPDPEAYSEAGRHNSYVNIGVQEYEMTRQGHHHQQQHPQQQRQRGTPEGKSSREQSADGRAESYKNLQVDANNQLQLLRQQQQLISKRMQLGQQQQEQQQQQQHWGMGGQQ